MRARAFLGRLIATLVCIGALAAACGKSPLGGSQPDAAAVGQGTGVAGTTNGGAAGNTGAAGTGQTACGPCPPADCQPGFKKVVDPAVSCCALCRRIDCSLVDCAPPSACPAGTHLEKVEGACCATCEPGPVDAACARGQEQYRMFRAQLIEKYNSLPCETDADCKFVFDDNACVSTCGFVVTASQAVSTVTNLESAAEAGCKTCPDPLALPCPFQVAVCSNGHCTSGAGRPN
jgi:hypothetical protein